jgi:hypothetical protein
MLRLNQLEMAAGQQQPPDAQQLEQLVAKTWTQLFDSNTNTEDPDGWFDRLKVRLPFSQAYIPPVTRKQPPNTLRLVCISDTHERALDVSSSLDLAATWMLNSGVVTANLHPSW